MPAFLLVCQIGAVANLGAPGLAAETFLESSSPAETLVVSTGPDSSSSGPSERKSERAAINKPLRTNDKQDSSNDRSQNQQAQEADFQDREEPEAIRTVGREMQLTKEETDQLLDWEESFRASVRVIWVHESGNAEARRKGRTVANLRRTLNANEKRLLGRRYYDFSEHLAREMNRLRWLRDGRVLPPGTKNITSD